MSYGTDALYDFAAHDPRRSTPRAIPKRSGLLTQNILGGVALACIAATCLWTIASHLTATESSTFEARFGDLPPAKSVKQVSRVTVVHKTVPHQHAGLFQGKQLSSSRPAIAGGQIRELAQHLSPTPTSGAPQLQAAVSARQPAREIAQNATPPLARPSRLASLQDAATDERPLSSAPRVLTEDKATVLALISNKSPSLFQKLFGRPKPEGQALAYASADGDITGSVPTILFDGKPKYDQWTAVYDISAKTVYLPDGTELEAHSGWGNRMDDPRHVNIKMRGATPPHVYDLAPREAIFHGDEALRLHPVGGEGRIFGRVGLLTHSYLAGPRGDSNGCISFKDYGAFIRAYKRGMFKRMVVVARLT